MLWTILYIICMIWVFSKLFVLSLKLAWGIMKITFFIFLLPLVLIGLVFAGLFVIAVPILAIIGLFTLLEAA